MSTSSARNVILGLRQELCEVFYEATIFYLLLELKILAGIRWPILGRQKRNAEGAEPCNELLSSGHGTKLFGAG